MLLCKGHGCRYRKVCSRYVIGTGMTQYAGSNDTWMDHCLNAKKFVRIGNADDAQCPKQKEPDKD